MRAGKFQNQSLDQSIRVLNTDQQLELSCGGPIAASGQWANLHHADDGASERRDNISNVTAGTGSWRAGAEAEVARTGATRARRTGRGQVLEGPARCDLLAPSATR